MHVWLCVCALGGVGVVGRGVGGWRRVVRGHGKNTCATGNLSLSKECDCDPGMKVSVCLCAFCAQRQVLSYCTQQVISV